MRRKAPVNCICLHLHPTTSDPHPVAANGKLKKLLLSDERHGFVEFARAGVRHCSVNARKHARHEDGLGVGRDSHGTWCLWTHSQDPCHDHVLRKLPTVTGVEVVLQMTVIVFGRLFPSGAWKVPGATRIGGSGRLSDFMALVGLVCYSLSGVLL